MIKRESLEAMRKCLNRRTKKELIDMICANGDLIPPTSAPLLERPYAIECARRLYQRDGAVTGVIAVTIEDMLEVAGDDLTQLLVGRLIDGNLDVLCDDAEVILTGCDAGTVYLTVTCYADPYEGLGEEDYDDEYEEEGGFDG